MKILLDMDDVMEDLLGAWLDWLNKKYGINVQREDIYEWSMHGCMEGYILSGILTKDDIYKPLYEESFWDTVKPKENAVESVLELNSKHDIYVATASHYKTIAAKVERCLFKYFDFLNWNQIITIHDKSMLNADILVDDNYNNIKNFVAVNKHRHGILLRAPYNKKELIYSNMYSANNWNDIMKDIDRIAKLMR